MFVLKSVDLNSRKHIIGALPFIGSNGAVKVMRDLIRQRGVDSETMSAWVTAFALIPRPDSSTLFALMPLLEFEHEIPDAQFILSYSAVVHAYCANQENHCIGIGLKPIDDFLQRLEATITQGCLPRSHTLPEIKQVAFVEPRRIWRWIEKNVTDFDYCRPSKLSKLLVIWDWKLKRFRIHWRYVLMILVDFFPWKSACPLSMHTEDCRPVRRREIEYF